MFNYHDLNEGVLKNAVRARQQIYGKYSGPKPDRPELRDGKPEPVNFLERIAYYVGIYRIEKQPQDDNRGNPDFE